MKKYNDKDQYIPINWNNIEDMVDKLTWDKLISQFWVDTRIPVSNDLDDWRVLSQPEKEVVQKVFGGLTLLDTLQSQDAIDAIKPYARSQKELALYTNIQFMESVHAKSYSTIFSTLNSKSEIEDIFAWVHENEYLQKKAHIIDYWYKNGTPAQKQAASVLLESFLFYSGFYTPLRYLGYNKLVNCAEIIRLIIKDESCHGTYIGYKYQLNVAELPEEEQEEMRDWVYKLMFDLYKNEVNYARELYDEVGWTEDVLVFMRYNANKALQNLGYDPLFPETASDVNPVVMNGLSTTSSTHDFFSQVGNSYLLGEVEAMDEDDYDF